MDPENINAVFEDMTEDEQALLLHIIETDECDLIWHSGGVQLTNAGVTRLGISEQDDKQK